MAADGIMEGWLIKKAVRTASKMSWKKRWIRLANKNLTYSKTQGGKAILTLPLTRNTKVRSCKLHFPNELEVVFERVTFYAYSQSSDAAGEIKLWVDAIQEAIDELDPEAVAARKAKEAAAAAIARKLDLTWKEDDEKWDDSKGRLGNAATPGHLLTPMQRRLRQQLEEGMGEGGMSFLDLVMGAKSMVGKAWAWGANGEGEAGVGTLAKGGMTSPAHIESLRRLHAPVLLAAGSMHAAALTNENELFVWGRNEEGQLAIGPKAKRSMRPYLVRPLRSYQVTHVACGHTHTLAVVSTGEAFAWGSSSTGALAIGPPTDEDENVSEGGNAVVTRHEPTKMVDVGPLFARHAALVFAGKYNSALITAEGECLICGSNGAGQLGFGIDQLGLSVHEMRPARLEGTSEIQLVALGDTFSAFLVDGGVLYITGLIGKGADEFDQLRLDSAWLIDNCDAPSPRTIFGEEPVVKTIAAGTEHLLVVTKYTDRDQGPIAPKAPSGAAASGDGGSAPSDAGMPANQARWWHVYAMGRGYLGTEGADETDVESLTFLRDAGGEEISLEDGGKALQDFSGELVTMNFGWSPELVPVVGLQGQEVDEVACGERFSLARTHDGRIYTWGDNDHGQLGNGYFIDTNAPMEGSKLDLGNEHSQQIVAGRDFAMTLQFQGCFGQKQERYLTEKYGNMWLNKVFGEHRGKRHGVEEQFMRDFGSEMAAAVKEYTDAEGITDLGDSSLAALIDAVNAQETGEEGE